MSCGYFRCPPDPVDTAACGLERFSFGRSDGRLACRRGGSDRRAAVRYGRLQTPLALGKAASGGVGQATPGPCVEDLTDLLGKGCRCKRLLQECDLVLEDAMPDDLVVGIAREEKDVELRMQRLQALGGFAAAE